MICEIKTFLEININTKEKGIRDLLSSIIKYGKDNNIYFIPMREIYDMEISKIRK